MHELTLTEAGAPPDAAWQARHGSPATLAALLQASRADTLQTFAQFEAALPGLAVPERETLNPPLWELGHIGWFQGWWTTRFEAWRQGWQADPLRPRSAYPDSLPGDAWYDSSRVPHASRWALPLPDAQRTRALLAAQLDATLSLLASLPPEADDAALYFFRLALLHEDMHHEAALYMARELGIAVADARWQPPVLSAPPAPLRVAGGLVPLGRAAASPGFAFDNECGRCTVAVADFEIDAQPLRWDDLLPFVRDQGYTQARWWTDAGTRWLASQGGGAARARAVQQAARPGTAAAHLCLHEALAWCRWAGRRLPTEAEWVQAQRSQGAAFRWGQVWEWTASAFAPFEGFEPHPYREYSAPWFDGRPVLKGASCFTQPRLRHPDYRNFFPAGRCDIPAGWRSCRNG